MPRVAVVFGQFGIAADPLNLPHFRDRVAQAGIETILVQHTDTQRVYDFLHGYKGKCGIVGASLGAGVAPIMAGYLKPQTVDFIGGFQPSDWDPVMHSQVVDGQLLRCVTVPKNVRIAVCFRNPIAAGTAGLGHAIYVEEDPSLTELEIIPRPDVHPGDFGVAADTMFEKLTLCLNG